MNNFSNFYHRKVSCMSRSLIKAEGQVKMQFWFGTRVDRFVWNIKEVKLNVMFEKLI